LTLAFGVVERREAGLPLRFGHALDGGGAFFEKAKEGFVDRVDLAAEIVELAQSVAPAFAPELGRHARIAVANLSIQVARSGSFRISW